MTVETVIFYNSFTAIEVNRQKYELLLQCRLETVFLKVAIEAVVVEILVLLQDVPPVWTTSCSSSRYFSQTWPLHLED